MLEEKIFSRILIQSSSTLVPDERVVKSRVGKWNRDLQEANIIPMEGFFFFFLGSTAELEWEINLGIIICHCYMSIGYWTMYVLLYVNIVFAGIFFMTF